MSNSHYSFDDGTPLLLDEPERPSSIFCCFFAKKSKNNRNENNNGLLHFDTNAHGPIIVSKIPINQKSISRHRASFYSRLGVHVDGPPPESREDKPEELLNEIRSPVLRGGPKFRHQRNK